MTIVERAGQRLRSHKPGARQPEPDAEQKSAEQRDRADVLSLSPRASGSVIIDRPTLYARGLMGSESKDYQLGREYQRIKRPILDSLAKIKTRSDDEAQPCATPNLIMLTSAKPHEGKTFTLFNLALSLAQELDYRVVLVDADLNRPKLTRSLDLDERPGLSDLLTDPHTEIEDALVATDRDRLLLLPAGTNRENSTERLSSRRMRQIVGRLGEDTNQIVLFDSAPLLYAAEAQALASHMGQILFVVKAMATERRAVESALSLLDPVAANVSIILNQARAGFGEEYAGYYGSYPTNNDAL